MSMLYLLYVCNVIIFSYKLPLKHDLVGRTGLGHHYYSDEGVTEHCCHLADLRGTLPAMVRFRYLLETHFQPLASARILEHCLDIFVINTALF